MKTLDEVVYDACRKSLDNSIDVTRQEARAIGDAVRLWLYNAQSDAVSLLEKVIMELEAGWSGTTLPLWIWKRRVDFWSGYLGKNCRIYDKFKESFVFEATAELRLKNSGSGLKIEQKWKRVSGEGFEWRPIPLVEEGEK